MLKKLTQALYQIERSFYQNFMHFNQQDMLVPSFVGGINIPRNESTNQPSFSEIIGDIFLMAAPKSKVNLFRVSRYFNSINFRFHMLENLANT